MCHKYFGFLFFGFVHLKMYSFLPRNVNTSIEVHFRLLVTNTNSEYKQRRINNLIIQEIVRKPDDIFIGIRRIAMNK